MQILNASQIIFGKAAFLPKLCASLGWLSKGLALTQEVLQKKKRIGFKVFSVYGD